MSGQKRPKLDCMILCDAVSDAPGGKKTLYGLFDTINAQEFPCVHSVFSVFLRFVSGLGTHEMKLQILDPDDTVIFQGQNKIEIKEDRQFAGADFVMRFHGFTFKTPGVYKAKVILDGEPIQEEKSFRVKSYAE